MFVPEFDRNKMEWDSWRAFYVNLTYYGGRFYDGRFIQFDTGEVIVANHRWSPDERQVYKDLHIQVIATDDHDCPRLFIPGNDHKPVPKSHLNHKGQQVLLLDHDHQRAVSLDGWMTKYNAGRTIPERFRGRDTRGVNAYYAGPNATPVGAMPITRHFPVPLTFEQRKHINELHDACKVWLAMQGDPKQLMWDHREARDVQTKVSYFVDTPFKALTMTQRLAIAAHGFDMTRKEENDWLTFKTWFEFNTQEDNE